MGVVFTINKNDTKESIRRKWEEWSGKSKARKGFPAHKYTGKIKSFGEDGVTCQKRIRDEWD